MEDTLNPSWVATLRRANCSALIKLKNSTGDTLIRTDFLLPSGMWREFPPEIIEPGDEAWFGSESLGFCTGTEGTVMYQIAQGQEPFVFQWTVPFFTNPTAVSQAGKNYRIGRDVQINSRSVTVEFSVHDPCEGDYRHNKSEAQIITLASIIYESWKIELKNANRSLMVTIDNTTDYRLVLKTEKIDHGIWRCPPPKEVKPHVLYDFGAESHGIFGTQGRLEYTIVSTEAEDNEIDFSWEVPIRGNPKWHSNIFSVDPTAMGLHNEITLHFSTDELFIVKSKKEKEGNVDRDGGNSKTSASVEEKTGYGFET